MNLTTRCPHCQTRFRIVLDQLRISGGWVRCGHCQQVFDARQGLDEGHNTATSSSSPAVFAPEAAPPTPPQPSHSEVHAPQPANAEHVPTTSQPSPPQSASEAPTATDFEAAPPSSIPTSAKTPESPVRALQAQDEQTTAPQPETAKETVAEFAPALLEQAALEPAAQSADASESELTLPEPAPALQPRPSVAEIATQLGIDLNLNTENTESKKSTENIENTFLAPSENQEENPTSAPVLADSENTEKTSGDAAILPNPANEIVEDLTLKNTQTEPPTPEKPNATDDPQHPLPQFIRRAQRQAWWARPWLRFSMGMLMMLLPLALVVQVAWHQRQLIGAWQPQWRPALQVMCVTLGCTMGPWRNIEAAVIVGSSFAPLDEINPSDVPAQAPSTFSRPAWVRYQFEVSLRNLSSLPIATPLVEITLHDVRERALLRRAFEPAQLGLESELRAQSEHNASATLELDAAALPAPVAGYRVVLFYP